MNYDKIKEFYHQLESNNYFAEFETALVIYELGYTVNDINEITEEEMYKIRNRLGFYDSLFNESLIDDVDDIINNSRIDEYNEKESVV